MLKLKSLTAALAVWFIATSSFAYADDSQLVSMLEKLQNQMKDMQSTINQQNKRIQELESRPAGNVEGSVSAPVAAAPMSDYEFNNMLDTATGGAQKWLKDLKFAGDLRLRYEAFQYGSGSTSETDPRNRFRYRLRFGFEKKLGEDFQIGFGLASGEAAANSGANNDPTSTNTTFDNNFNFKNIYVEKAYASYTPSFLKNVGLLEKANVTAGKMNNPFEKGSSDMIWDRDVKPEGVAEKFDLKLIDTPDFGLNSYVLAGQYILDEDSSVGGDANLYAFQVGINPIIYTPVFERPLDLLQAFSMYYYDNYARSSNFLINGVAAASGTRGNPNFNGASTELDAGRFQVFESYTELAFYPFNFPVRPFFDFARNIGDSSEGVTAILDESNAFGFGAKFGSIVKQGDWEALAAYKYIGANSTVGMFNDSDFGDGHAGKRGFVLKGGYALTDSLSLNAAAFFVENLNPGASGSGIIDQQQRRFQVDMVWKF